MKDDPPILGLLQLVALCAVIAMVMLSVGCASGIVMTDAEAAACKDKGCSVWTETELRQLISKVFREAYTAGSKDRGAGI